MMKKIEVKLLTGRSSSEGSNLPGEKLSLSVTEAINLVESGQAVPVSKQAYNAELKILKDAQQVELEKQAEAKAILEREHIEAELNGLYEDVVRKEAELNGAILEPEQILEMVEDLKKRVLPAENGEKSLFEKIVGK